MKIAHVIGSFGIGGGERVALDLASGQQRDGVEVVTISLEEPADGPLATEYAARGIDIVRVHKRPGGVDPTLWPRLSTVFKRGGIDIVHTHNPPPLIYGAPASFFARAGCVHTKHGANAMPSRRRLLVRAASRFCDAYVAVSQTTAAEAARDRDVAPKKLMTIENGIDLSRFAPSAEARSEARRSLGLSAEAFIVGTVGRLVREKNQAALVQAMAPLLGPKVRLLIVGDGEERAAVERAVAGLGDKSQYVWLLGARNDTPRIYAALDVFALSSDSEGLPLVVIEAMASGLPVVSTAVGGIRAVVVEGVTGALVPAGDVNALSARLAQLAASPMLGVRWGTEGRRRALSRYSAERMVNDYFAVYERIRRS